MHRCLSFSVLLLLLLMPFGACAVSESHSFDKHFITFHCCSSCAENKIAIHCRSLLLEDM